eukprot:1328255-Amorphochlora_amoeboformis.AAC.2
MAIYNMLLFMASFSHYRAMTTNPGAVPKNAEPLPALTMELKRLGKGVPKCRRSGIFKPPRAHYDRQVHIRVHSNSTQLNPTHTQTYQPL